MCHYASWQNFENVGSPANLAITVRTASKCCPRSRSQSKNTFDLNPISWVVTGVLEPWPECHCVFGKPQPPYITSSYVKHYQLVPDKVPGRMLLNFVPAVELQSVTSFLK